MPLHADSFVYEPDDAYPLYITAKRYTNGDDLADDDNDSWTLILLHSTSFHKETWEPTLERLFALAMRRGRGTRFIREAWSIECPNHGASAVMNEHLLLLPEFHNNFSCDKYAYAVHRFLTAGPTKGARVDFAARDLAGIGHSLGGVALSTVSQLIPRVLFQTILLIEPMLSPRGREHLKKLRFELVRGAYERRDVWPSRQQAREALKRRNRAKLWDSRVLDSYVNHALRVHQAAYDDDTPYDGVTLCLTRQQESAMYKDFHGPTKAVKYLDAACVQMPVHIILGTKNDFVPKEVHEAILDPASPRRFASTTFLPNCGHLVPQEAPVKLAAVLLDLLDGGRQTKMTAKL